MAFWRYGNTGKYHRLGRIALDIGIDFPRYVTHGWKNFLASLKNFLYLAIPMRSFFLAEFLVIRPIYKYYWGLLSFPCHIYINGVQVITSVCNYCVTGNTNRKRSNWCKWNVVTLEKHMNKWSCYLKKFVEWVKKLSKKLRKQSQYPQYLLQVDLISNMD